METKFVCFAEECKHSNKTALATKKQTKLNYQLLKAESWGENPAQAKLEKDVTLDPLEEGFEHVGDALLVRKCSVLWVGGGG